MFPATRRSFALAVALVGLQSPLLAQDAPTTAPSNQKLDQPTTITDTYPLKDDADRAKSAKLVQQVVVDLLAMQNFYKQAHWNVTGPLYLPLHEYFQTQSDYYGEQADVFAERLLHLGITVDGRYDTIAQTSSLPKFPAGYLTDNDAITVLLNRVGALQDEVYAGIKATEETDAPTSNKLQDLAYAVDKNAWQLRVHLQRPGGNGESLPWAKPATDAPAKSTK